MNKKNPRITSGIYKNTRLKVPANTRPITDRVKKTIFDILGNNVKSCTFLDLFSGSGSVAIEALSREASFVVMVENSKEAFEVLKNNLKQIQAKRDSHKILFMDYSEFLKKYNGNFDFIFLDPPFLMQKRIKIQSLSNFLKPGSTLIYKIESNLRNQVNIPLNFNIIKEKKLGINTIIFMQLKN